MPSFGPRSLAKLVGVDPRLRRVHDAVIAHFDHTVTDGVRTLDQERAYVASGASHTLNSKHLPNPQSGFGEATDSTPYPDIDWSKVEQCLHEVTRIDPRRDLLRFYYFQGYFKGTADQLGVPIRQGVDWNGHNDFQQHFDDLPHNELKPTG